MTLLVKFLICSFFLSSIALSANPKLKPPENNKHQMLLPLAYPLQDLEDRSSTYNQEFEEKQGWKSFEDNPVFKKKMKKEANLNHKCIILGKYLIEDRECIQKCPEEFYFPNQELKICQKCPQNCSTCINSRKCEVCQKNFQISVASDSLDQQTCVPVALVRSNHQPFQQQVRTINFGVLSSVKKKRLLQTCPSECTSCSVGTSVCLGCTPGFVLFNGVCQNTVPTGYLNISGIAQPCTSPCSQCVGDLANCTSCVFDYYLFETNNTCLYLNCPQFYYEDEVGRTCEPCISPCYDCSSETACINCPVGSSFYFFSNTSECVDICPFGFYESSSTQNCEPCESPCEDCNSVSSCKTCLDGFYLLSGGDECVVECPSGFIENDIANQCKPCTSPCQTCEGTATTCFSCVTNTYLFESNCESSCPIGYVTNFTSRVCEDCPLPCMSCIETNCYQCESPYTLDTVSHSCVTSCPHGTYSSVNTVLDPVTNNLQCDVCDSSCSRCSQEFFCTLCAPGYYWVQSSASGECVTSCPTDIAPILNIDVGACVSCSDPQCLLCDINDFCTQCSQSTYLFEGGCLTECPAGYVPDSTLSSCQVFVQEEDDQAQLIEFVPIFVAAVGTFHVLGLVIARNMIKTTIGRTALIFGLLAASWGIPASLSLARALYTQQDYFDNKYDESSRLLQDGVEKSASVDPHLFLYLLYGAGGFLFCLNVGVVIWAGMKVLNPKEDPVYAQWRENATFWQKAMIYIVQFLTFFNFNSQNILWSKLKCTPKLQSMENLQYMKVASLLGLVPATLVLCSIIPLMFYVKQLRVSFIDVIITTTLAAIFSLLALRKDPDFFEQQIFIDPDTIQNRYRDKHEYEEFQTAEKPRFHAIYQTKSQIDTPLHLDSSQRDFISDNHSNYKKFQILPAKITQGSYYGVCSNSLTSNEEELGVDCFLRGQATSRKKNKLLQEEQERKKKQVENRNKESLYYSEQMQSRSSQSLVNKQSEKSESVEAVVLEEEQQVENFGVSSEQKIGNSFKRSPEKGSPEKGSPEKVGAGKRLQMSGIEGSKMVRNISSASGSIIKVSAVSPQKLKEVRISKQEYNRLLFKQRIWNMNKPYEELSEEDFDMIRQRFWNFSSKRYEDEDRWKQRKWNTNTPKETESEQSSEIIQKPWNFEMVKKPNVILVEEESSYIATEDLNKPTEQIEFEDGIGMEKSDYMRNQSKIWMKKQTPNLKIDEDDSAQGEIQQREEEEISREGQYSSPKKSLYQGRVEDPNKEQKEKEKVEIEGQKNDTAEFNNSKEKWKNDEDEEAGQEGEKTYQNILDQEEIEREYSQESKQDEEDDYYLHAVDSGNEDQEDDEEEDLQDQKLLVQMEEKGQYIDFVGKQLMEIEEIAAALKKLKLKRRKRRKRQSSRSVSKKKRRNSSSAIKHPYKFRQLSAKKPVDPATNTKKLTRPQKSANTGRVYVLNFKDYLQLKEKAHSIMEGQSQSNGGKKKKNFKMKIQSRSQKQKTQRSASSSTLTNLFQYRLANSQSELKSFSRERDRLTRDNTRKLHESTEKNSEVLRPGSSAIQRSGSASLSRMRSVYNNPVVRKL